MYVNFSLFVCSFICPPYECYLSLYGADYLVETVNQILKFCAHALSFVRNTCAAI